MVRNEKVYEKTMNLKVSAEEHRAIKLLATEAGVTIKQFVLAAMDKAHPNWQERGKTK